MGQMVRENIKILTKFKNYLSKILILQIAGCKLGKTMPVSWYTSAVLLCLFFQSDINVIKIKRDLYASIYPSKMAPLIKVNAINKVKVQFGQQINPK